MAHLAADLRAEGFDVDHRRAATLRQGLRDHVEEFGVTTVLATEPMSWDARELLSSLGVELVRDDHFLCHYDEFARWAGDRKRLTMEDFYRWQRVRLGVLVEEGLDGPEPVGGRWNFDQDNREPPP
jgi:deoxyribodipyrimidine photolyase-related protein